MDSYDILTELCNALGMSQEDVTKFKKEFDGYLTESEIKSDTKTSTTSNIKEEPQCTRDTSNLNECASEEKCKCDSELGLFNHKLSEDVYVHKDTCFELFNHVGKHILAYDPIQILFERKVDGMYYPGITNKQLLWVLYVRYIDDPKKLDLIKQLLMLEI